MGNCCTFLWKQEEEALLSTCYWCKGRFNIDDMRTAEKITMVGEPLFCIGCLIKLGEITVNTI